MYSTHHPPPTQPTRREGSPFGSYCPIDEHCEGRFLNQTAGALVAGRASGSGTNEYYSLNIGGLHLVVYNTMEYLGLGRPMRKEQLAWLKADLAGVDRATTPWILLATHVPMYCSAIDATLPPYRGCLADGVKTSDAIMSDLEPLMLQYGVDLYAYGHVHAYQSTWPIKNGSLTKASLDSPDAPVHVLTGAAGPPGVPETFSLPPPWSRSTASLWSYGRVTCHNATHLTYEHVRNTDGVVIDSWTIFQPRHGPFV